MLRSGLRQLGTCLIVTMAASVAIADDRNPIDPPLKADECKIVGKRNAEYLLSFWAGNEATAVFDGRVIYNNVGDKVTGLTPMRIKLPKSARRGYHMLVVFIAGKGEGKGGEWGVDEIVEVNGSVAINSVCNGGIREEGDDVRYVGVVRFVPK